MLSTTLISKPDNERLRAVHRLLQSTLAPGLVEDLSSFIDTVSSATDSPAAPQLVCVMEDSLVQGALVGSYLKKINVGMVLYGAVNEALRGQGLYTSMRRHLIDAFNNESARSGTHRSVDYVVSEQQPGSWLLSLYVNRLACHIAPCDYQQPQVQGLRQKSLHLVFQPIRAKGPPNIDFVAEVVREIYQHIYKITEPSHNETFRRIVQSLRAG